MIWKISTFSLLAIFLIVPWCYGYELNWINFGGLSLEDTYQVAGVIAPFVAIYVAVWIPKKIAEEQNKIALFEKRYALYTWINHIQTNIHVASEVETLDLLKIALFDLPFEKSTDVGLNYYLLDKLLTKSGEVGFIFSETVGISFERLALAYHKSARLVIDTDESDDSMKEIALCVEKMADLSQDFADSSMPIIYDMLQIEN